MKKLLGFLAVTFILFAVAMGIMVRLAPRALVRVLETSLDKDVSIKAVQYRFPFGFVVQDLSLEERYAFKSENCLHASRAHLNFAPQDLIKGIFGVRDITLEGLKITVRKRSGDTAHAFEALPASAVSLGTKPFAALSSAQKVYSRIVIHNVVVKSASIEYIDYDIDDRGFALLMHNAQLRLEEVRFDRPQDSFRYAFETVITQGRETEKASLDVTGDFRLSNREWNAQVKLEGVWIPYFEPYYRGMAFSSVEDGIMDAQAAVSSKDKRQTANSKIHLRRLQLQSLDPTHQILGIDMASILNVLKTNKGQLELDLSLEWGGGKGRFEDAIERSMRDALKNTVRLDIDATVSSTIDRIVDSQELSGKDWKSAR